MNTCSATELGHLLWKKREMPKCSQLNGRQEECSAANNTLQVLSAYITYTYTGIYRDISFVRSKDIPIVIKTDLDL